MGYCDSINIKFYNDTYIFFWSDLIDVLAVTEPLISTYPVSRNEERHDSRCLETQALTTDRDE